MTDFGVDLRGWPCKTKQSIAHPRFHVYAWSGFRAPLAKQFGWSISEVTLTFTISIFVLGIAAFFGGIWLNRMGPRIRECIWTPAHRLRAAG